MKRTVTSEITDLIEEHQEPNAFDCIIAVMRNRVGYLCMFLWDCMSRIFYYGLGSSPFDGSPQFKELEMITEKSRLMSFFFISIGIIALLLIGLFTPLRFLLYWTYKIISGIVSVCIGLVPWYHSIIDEGNKLLNERSLQEKSESKSIEGE